jgi:site-specific recombinase XerD
MGRDLRDIMEMLAHSQIAVTANLYTRMEAVFGTG